MAKRERVNLYDAYAGSTPEEKEILLNAMRKKRTLWWILTLIPLVNWVCGPFLMFTRNTLRVIESNGRKKPGGLINILVVLYCLIIPPIVMNWIIGVLGERFQNKVILGVDEILKDYTYVD